MRKWVEAGYFSKAMIPSFAKAAMQKKNFDFWSGYREVQSQNPIEHFWEELDCHCKGYKNFTMLNLHK
jgi:hypothetical protein